MVDETAPRTPGVILFALYAMALAAASPFLSEIHARLTGHTGKNELGIFLGWLILGAIAAIAGIFATVIGCTMQPRTRLTHIAVMVALLEIGAVLYFFFLA